MGSWLGFARRRVRQCERSLGLSFGVILTAASLTSAAALGQTYSTTTGAPTVGPSFNCLSENARREPLAQMICGDAALARLDLSFVQAFQALQHQAGEMGQRSVRQEANDFHSAVLTRCGVPTAPPRTGRGASDPIPIAPPATARPCVVSLYREQRQAWLLRLLPNARQEAERPLERHISLQGALAELGFLPRGSSLDGNYGPATRNAIMSWQRSIGLAEDGFISDRDAVLIERAVQQLRVVEQQEAQAREEAERRQRAQAERDAFEARARLAAELRAREDEERRRRAAIEREEALAGLLAAVGRNEDEAVVIVTLGRDGGRLRRTLRGQLTSVDANRPPLACSILGPASPSGFADFARERQGELLAGNPQAFRTACPFGEDVLGQDILLVHHVAASRATSPTIVALTRALADGRAEIIGRVLASDYVADIERRRREAADEAARLAALSNDVRRDALGGVFGDWGAVAISSRPATAACVIGQGGQDWIDIVRSILPTGVAGGLQRAVADVDADRQFARLLSNECGVLVARGADFGDVLRGLAANRREAIVLPVRASHDAVERLFVPRPNDAVAVAVPSTPLSPAPQTGVSAGAGRLTGRAREMFLETTYAECTASPGQIGTLPVQQSNGLTSRRLSAFCSCMAVGLADEMSLVDLLKLGIAADAEQGGGAAAGLVSPAEMQRVSDRALTVIGACLQRSLN